MKRHLAWVLAALAACTLSGKAMGASADENDLPWRPQKYHSLFSEAERARPYVFARSHDLHDWPFLDGQWEGILADSEGYIWFGIASHSFEHGAHLFRYDPKSDKVNHVADLDQACGEKLTGNAPQQKIHCTMWEDGDVIYAATCEGHHSEQIAYAGGYWLRIHKKTGKVEAMAKSVSNDGLITVAFDRKNKLLYAHTNVKGMLLQFNPATGEEKVLGMPEKGGPAQWPRGISLMVDPEGNVYGARPPACTLWQYSPATGEIKNLDCQAPPPADVAAGDQKAIEKYNKDGRLAMTLWDEKDQCFYAVRGDDEMLLRFSPPLAGRAAKLEALRPIGLPGDHRYGQRYSACTLVLIGRTIWYTPYTGWGGEAHVVSYDLESGKLSDYGPVIVDASRRVTEAQSLAVDREGRLYSVGFVFCIEGRDPVRPWAMRDEFPFHPRLLIMDPRTDFKGK